MHGPAVRQDENGVWRRTLCAINFDKTTYVDGSQTSALESEVMFEGTDNKYHAFPGKRSKAELLYDAMRSCRGVEVLPEGDIVVPGAPGRRETLIASSRCRCRKCCPGSSAKDAGLQPTPLAKMTVKALKEVLKAKGLDSKGLKAELVQRLQEALTAAAESDDAEEEAADAEGFSDGGQAATACQMNCQLLREVLKANGLHTTGSKAALVSRLLEAFDGLAGEPCEDDVEEGEEGEEVEEDADDDHRHHHNRDDHDDRDLVLDQN
jgi:hypothetical protein